MPHDDGRSAPQSRDRAQKVGLRHALVGHQPDAREALARSRALLCRGSPARFALALLHGASYSDADERG
jgi:hypothetical protein